MVPPEVHLEIPKGYCNPKDFSNRAFPILESKMPKFELRNAHPDLRIPIIYEIINWLDVESTKRYSANSGKTYCNIYAYDVAYLLGIYIPRVWWMENIENFSAPVEKLYGVTLREMNCNSLFNWFEEFGSAFNWIRCNNETKVQEMVNSGTIGVIIARNKKVSCPGHIAIILPETADHHSIRNGNNVISPLQSQAGEQNQKVFCNLTKWWRNEKFFKSCFYVYNI